MFENLMLKDIRLLMLLILYGSYLAHAQEVFVFHVPEKKTELNERNKAPDIGIVKSA